MMISDNTLTLEPFLEFVSPHDPDAGRISLATYRLLAHGDPVAVEDVANEAGVPVSQAQACLEDWPGVYRDDDGRIVGYWGLALPEMDHRFEVGGRTLYTWCAWDALFIPELIDAEAAVTSTCPETGTEIDLAVAPACITAVSPSSAALSFRHTISADVIQSFCSYVHFFESRQSAEVWSATRDNVTVLSIDEAFELGHRKNRLQYGDLLSRRT